MIKTAIKERAITIPADGARGILSGDKTQHRVPVKPQPSELYSGPRQSQGGNWFWDHDYESDRWIQRKCPFGVVGDTLYVRETWADVNTESGPAVMYRDGSLRYCSDDAFPVEYDRYPNCGFTMWWSDLLHRESRKCKSDHQWRSSATMPRWASRLRLDVVAIRVERLQDISEDDARGEGIKVCNPGTPLECYWDYLDGESRTPVMFKPVDSFYTLWDSINGNGAWALNPWVWVTEFKRV